MEPIKFIFGKSQMNKVFAFETKTRGEVTLIIVLMFVK